jgi:hypothetical protein
MNTSLTGTGLIVVIVTELLRAFGVENTGGVQEAVVGLLTFIGWVALVYGQLRRKDLSWGIFRK